MQKDMLHLTNIEPQEAASPTQKPTTAIIIANPSAGSYQQNKHNIDDTVTYLNSHGWQVELKLTKQASDCHTFAREAAAEKLDVVIAVGGDGTLNDVIQELAGSETALGVLPSGTVNVWARELGIPLECEGARDVLLHGQIRRIDLGKVNERYFLLMASIGVDAEAIHTVEKHPIKRLGILGYFFLGAWLGIGYPNFQVVIQLGEHVIRTKAVQVVFGNTQLYAGAIKFTWRARCDDGLLDICLIRSQNIFGRISLVVDFLLQHKRRDRWVRYDSTDEIKIHTTRAVAMQVDGDPAGHTHKKGTPPTVIRIAAGALKVVVPQKLPAELFSQPE